MKQLTIYTKPDCHLCSVMKKAIYELKNELEFEFAEVNIEQDESLFEQYKYRIPVLKLNGKLIAKFSVDIEKLRTKLSKN